MQDETSPIDLAYQIAFRIAHLLLRTYWWFRRPRKGGILVAVWHLEKVLIIKNSYRREHTLPGGYKLRGESPEETGSRELLEECGIYVPIAQLREVYRREFLFEHRRDDVTIVETELAWWPRLRIDHREVSEARFVNPEELAGLLAVPHLTDYLRRRIAQPLPACLPTALPGGTVHGAD
jgi:8-oxo-dGTP diphosphatase